MSFSKILTLVGIFVAIIVGVSQIADYLGVTISREAKEVPIVFGKAIKIDKPIVKGNFFSLMQKNLDGKLNRSEYSVININDGNNNLNKNILLGNRTSIIVNNNGDFVFSSKDLHDELVDKSRFEEVLLTVKKKNNKEIILVFRFLLSGVDNFSVSEESFPSVIDPTYRIGVGDVLKVTLRNPGSYKNNRKDLMGFVESLKIKYEVLLVVNSAGRFYYSYAGRIFAAGRRTIQVERELESKLAKYISHPQISVSIEEFNSQRIFVTGSVKKPDHYIISNIPLTIRLALYKAGGVTENALPFAILYRHGRSSVIDLKALLKSNLKNFDMVSGDMLYVLEKRYEKKDNLQIFFSPSSLRL